MVKPIEKISCSDNQSLIKIFIYENYGYALGFVIVSFCLLLCCPTELLYDYGIITDTNLGRFLNNPIIVKYFLGSLGASVMLISGLAAIFLSSLKLYSTSLFSLFLSGIICAIRLLVTNS